jgi:ABC-type multidrug transport system fused ATPase/permease subunit
MNSHQSDREIEMGKLLNIMAYLPFTIRSAALEILRTYIPRTIALMALIGYFFYLDKDIGFLQLGTFILFVLILFLCTEKCVESAHVAMDDYLIMSEKIKDRVSNIGSVYASQQEDEEVKKYDKLNDINTHKYRSSLRKLWSVRLFEEFVIIGSFVIFNILMFRKKLPKKTAVALYVAEIYYFMRILQTTQANVVGIMTNVGEGKSQIEFLEELLKGKNIDDDDKARKIKVSTKKPALEMKNVSFRYDKGPWIIKNFNLTVRHGDRIFLKGSSGSGKSTLFQLILQALQPTKGDITSYGNDDEQLIRNEISLVDQRTNLFNETVMDNIKYGNSGLKDSEVKKIVKKLGTNIFDKLSNGLYTKAGIDGSTLSGGQRQLTVLLRTYFRKTKIILLDEVISGIDTENVPIALKMIEEIGKNRTLVCISHNDRIQEVCNRTVWMPKIRQD